MINDKTYINKLKKFLRKLQNKQLINSDFEKFNFNKLNDKQFLSENKINVDNDESYFVIVPQEYKELIVSLFCPLCELPLKTKEDILSYKECMLCYKCDNKWRDKLDIINKKSFKESEDWIEYIELRQNLAQQINIK